MVVLSTLVGSSPFTVDPCILSQTYCPKLVSKSLFVMLPLSSVSLLLSFSVEI